VLVFILIVGLAYIYPNLYKNDYNNSFTLYSIWEDYYESLAFNGVNDVFSLTTSYYSINNLELIIVGLLLLIGSVICVNLNRYYKIKKSKNNDNKFTLYNVFTNLVNTVFMRKQNLFSQNSSKIFLNIFKKTNTKKTAKITKD